MVVLYKCDVCGKIINDEERRSFYMRANTQPKVLGQEVQLYLDMCEECAEKIFISLKEWVKRNLRPSLATE